VAPQAGLEPATLRLTAECSAIELLRNSVRRRCTGRRLLEIESGDYLLSRAVASQVPSAFGGLTSVFGMGTGGTLQPLSPETYSVVNVRGVGARLLAVGLLGKPISPCLPSLAISRLIPQGFIRTLKTAQECDHVIKQQPRYS
jgi:hypothetical protein